MDTKQRFAHSGEAAIALGVAKSTIAKWALILPAKGRRPSPRAEFVKAEATRKAKGGKHAPKTTKVALEPKSRPAPSPVAPDGGSDFAERFKARTQADLAEQIPLPALDTKRKLSSLGRNRLEDFIENQRWDYVLDCKEVA